MERDPQAAPGSVNDELFQRADLDSRVAQAAQTMFPDGVFNPFEQRWRRVHPARSRSSEWAGLGRIRFALRGFNGERRGSLKQRAVRLGEGRRSPSDRRVREDCLHEWMGDGRCKAALHSSFWFPAATARPLTDIETPQLADRSYKGVEMTGVEKTSVFASLFLTATLCSPCLAQSPARKFTIYEYIPYETHVAGSEISATPPLKQYLESVGIYRIDVVYLPRFMTNGKPDAKKIEAIAKAALATPGIPVSFDTEFGNRLRPETVVPGSTEILNIYHRYNKVTPAGVYGTAPQNTYAWKPNIGHFDELNQRYASIANLVDFFSPVLYNYEGADTAAWQRAAVYNVAAAKQYNTGKPVIPYINIGIVLNPGQKTNKTGPVPVRMLTEAEMQTRLQTLYDLGASGCIVWASTRFRTPDGKAPVFDRDSGWGKALVDFAQAHQ
jgi:hypothetical protein